MVWDEDAIRLGSFSEHEAPSFAPIEVLAVVMTIYGCDKLLNGMPNPLFMLISGSLGTLCVAVSGQAVRSIMGLSCQIGTRALAGSCGGRDVAIGTAEIGRSAALQFPGYDEFAADTL